MSEHDPNHQLRAISQAIIGSGMPPVCLMQQRQEATRLLGAGQTDEAWQIINELRKLLSEMGINF